MKSVHVAKGLVAAAAIALAGFSIGASAQGQWGPGSGRGPGPGAMQGPRGGGMFQPANVAARLDQLKAELKLSGDQQTKFDAYADKIKAEAQAHAGFREGMQKLVGNTQAMADYRVTIAQHRAQALDGINQARKALVATLNPEQTAVLDHYGPGSGFGRHMHGGPGSGFGHGMGGGPGCGPRGV